MTKALAVKELERRGWHIEPAKGRSVLWMTSPTGQRDRHNPDDLVMELDEGWRVR